MPEYLRAILLLIASGGAERYVGQLLAETAAVYLTRRESEHIESWLRRNGLR